jgi:hypothetical protein
VSDIETENEKQTDCAKAKTRKNEIKAVIKRQEYWVSQDYYFWPCQMPEPQTGDGSLDARSHGLTRQSHRAFLRGNRAAWSWACFSGLKA